MSDDHVRETRVSLDEAQANRSQTLAAFAVTVGSDGVVAGLLGLHEREVRQARRSVGKENARNVADSLLVPPPRPQEEPVPEACDAFEPQVAAQAYPQPMAAPLGPPPAGPGPQGQQHGWPQPPHAQSAQAPPAPAQAGQNQAPPPVAQDAYDPTAGSSARSQGSAYPAAGGQQWTAALDALLVNSWQQGLDLTVLASQFGLELVQLVSRVQQLSAEGRLSEQQVRESGRHRRSRGHAAPEDDPGYDEGSSEHRRYTPSGMGVVPPQPLANHPGAWSQEYYEPYVPADPPTVAYNWDGILNHWQMASPGSQ
ncbi:hypothetical protein ACFYN0_32345 [Streptomyces sp. NPDC006704]|uniref:hypothetical protein n=1 Tax=Streptomyces sp. NPDC006704 TaxID=3364760 RepID=UPI003687CC10